MRKNFGFQLPRVYKHRKISNSKEQLLLKDHKIQAVDPGFKNKIMQTRRFFNLDSCSMLHERTDARPIGKFSNITYLIS